jgi:hypothetical protein
MSLKTSLVSYLMTNTFIASNFKWKIYRKRITRWEVSPPYIVYTTDWYENKLNQYQWNHGYRGRNLVIDVVWPYTSDDMLEQAWNEIIKLLWWFNGIMWDWKGTIKQVKYEDWYDEKSDFSVVRITFLAKEVF